MSEKQKFTEEEVKMIQTLREGNARKINEFGQIELEILLTNQKLDFLKNAKEKAQQEYTELQQQERDLVKTLNSKYGTGTVDLESGEFAPSK
jgi:hypothetical protein